MSDGPATCTVADLLAEPDLGLALATPAADVTRPIRWVQTTELLDPRPYLRPDELVCTVGTSLTSDEAVRTFVEAIAGMAAALCFGLGDVHDHPPGTLGEACRRAGIPLLTLPYGVAFLAVADVVDRRRRQASAATSLGRLVDLIRSGLAHPDSLADALMTHGLDPRSVVVAAWPAGSAHRLAAGLPMGVAAETADRTVTLTATVEPVVAAAAATGLRCGYADPAPLAQFTSALASAELALAAATTGGEPRGSADLDSFALLIESIPRERLRPFVVRLIEPLVAAGDQASPTYLETLRAFLAHDLSVGRTAKAQFLHPNTVRHRLGLIRSLTGRDPFVTEDVLALAVAVAAHDRDRRGR